MKCLYCDIIVENGNKYCGRKCMDKMNMLKWYFKNYKGDIIKLLIWSGKLHEVYIKINEFFDNPRKKLSEPENV